MQIYLKNTNFFRQGSRLIGPFLDAFLEEVGWTRECIDVVVPHQASRHALDLLTERLGFTGAQVVRDIAERGNVIAASPPPSSSRGTTSSRRRCPSRFTAR